MGKQQYMVVYQLPTRASATNQTNPFPFTCSRPIHFIFEYPFKKR